MFTKGMLFAVVLSQALPTFGAIFDRSVVHERVVVPSGWTASPIAARDDAPIFLQIGLVQRKIDDLEAKLKDVSTPGSLTYGQHLDKEEVDEYFAPSASSEKKVRAWLEKAGVESVMSDGHWISFNTTILEANTLLAAKYKRYTSESKSVIRTTEYSIPNHLRSSIDLVVPSTYFGRSQSPSLAATKITRDDRPTKRSLLVDPACSHDLGPTCLKQLYNIGTYKPCATSGSKIGFSAFSDDQQSASHEDLAVFEKLYNIPSQNITVKLINGGVDEDGAADYPGEANLDLQIIMGMSNPLPVTEFIIGGDGDPGLNTLNQATIEPFLPYYLALLAQPSALLPQVISDSYGNEEQFVPQAYAIRVCNAIGLLGLRGTSVLIASGDEGVGSKCKSNDGKNTNKFMPIFPATCPYATAVGGTQGLNTDETAYGPGYGYGGGAGGFSNYFSQPWYQATAVNKYLTKYISAKTMKYLDPFVNFQGRGFPDVSAHADLPGATIIIQGEVTDYGSGTSAAVPMMASVIALLNDARLRAGKSSLGFLNPLLYTLGSATFTDIVAGGATGCYGFGPGSGATGSSANFSYATGLGPIDPTWGLIPYASWNATVGWDPVTGLGTPNFEKLKAVVMSY